MLKFTDDELKAIEKLINNAYPRGIVDATIEINIDRAMDKILYYLYPNPKEEEDEDKVS